MKIRLEDAINKIKTILQTLGVPSSNAAIVATSLVLADARGIRSHGVNMLPAYLERISKGGIQIHETVEIIKETPSILMLDGKNGFGQVAVSVLVEHLIEKGASADIVCGSVRNINHCGALSFYTEKAARAGFLAFLFANANPTVAPFGSMEAVLGTNPLSIAIPATEPIILDMATSSVAKARIYRAAKNGEKIDPSWALDAEGNPTDDPNKAIKGVLNAMAGPKGSGLAIAVEALAGLISGAGITREVNSVHHMPEKGMNSGVFTILIKISSFIQPEEYNQRIALLQNQIKQAKVRPGNQTVYLPGELESISLQRARSEGIEYDDHAFDFKHK